MQLGRKDLRGVGASHYVASQRRRGGCGGRGRVSQRRQGDVTGRLAPRRAILAVELRREAVQGAGPHMVRGCWGVGGARRGGAALR